MNLVSSQTSFTLNKRNEGTNHRFEGGERLLLVFKKDLLCPTVYYIQKIIITKHLKRLY